MPVKKYEVTRKVQQENRRNYNKNRKEAPYYREGDLVAIKRTQVGPGLKLAPKYLGPYQVTRQIPCREGRRA